MSETKRLAKAASEVLPMLAAVMDEATDEDEGKFLEHLEESIQLTLDKCRGKELITAQEFKDVFELVSVGLIAMFALARSNLDEESMDMFNQAVHLFSPHISMLGVQGILAFEKLERH